MSKQGPLLEHTLWKLAYTMLQCQLPANFILARLSEFQLQAATTLDSLPPLPPLQALRTSLGTLSAGGRHMGSREA